jgi:hypothetical protein
LFYQQKFIKNKFWLFPNIKKEDYFDVKKIKAKEIYKNIKKGVRFELDDRINYWSQA